jgi:hypothetical protein
MKRKPKKLTPKQEHALAAKVMKEWETDAKKDEKYNKTRETVETKAGNKILAKFYDREVKWDDSCGKKRGRIVKSERKKARS